MQSKKHSFIEACVNTGIGFLTTLLFAPLIYWVCNVEITSAQMGLATFLFTIISIARGYVIRRFFNKKTDNPYAK